MVHGSPSPLGQWSARLREPTNPARRPSARYWTIGMHQHSDAGSDREQVGRYRTWAGRFQTYRNRHWPGRTDALRPLSIPPAVGGVKENLERLTQQDGGDGFVAPGVANRNLNRFL